MIQSYLLLMLLGFCKNEKTLKVTRTVSNLIDEVCFSRTPITVCRRHCMPETSSPRPVTLVCLPRLSPTARRLTAKYHSGKTLLTDEILAIESSSSFITRQVQVPDRCVPSL